jgi:NAD(P)-dependent dehydrogenase (short-subunit alcohol dehydrogenase family)
LGLKLLDLTGRVAVVLGGNSGLGRAIATGLAEAGADVAATGRRAELVETVAAEIEELGRRTIRGAVDVTDRSTVDAYRDTVIAQLGRVDILVNAPGRTGRRNTETLPELEWLDVMNINLNGIFYACQSFHDALAASGHGRIINITSLAAFVGLKDVAAYTASKSALMGLTRNLAVDWADHGINVNAIAPGVFPTDLNKEILDGTERGREYLMRIPMKRFGDPKEIAGAAVLLASDAASYITGQTIIVDGGFLASGVNS